MSQVRLVLRDELVCRDRRRLSRPPEYLCDHQVQADQMALQRLRIGRDALEVLDGILAALLEACFELVDQLLGLLLVSGLEDVDDALDVV